MTLAALPLDSVEAQVDQVPDQLQVERQLRDQTRLRHKTAIGQQGHHQINPLDRPKNVCSSGQTRATASPSTT
jgi:hypothetical protein